MIVVRFKMHCRPGTADDVGEALARVVPASRALDGVVSFDIGRDVVDPDAFIATEVFEDRAALDRQEALPEVTAAMAVLERSLATEPDATIFDVAGSAAWAG